MRVCKLFTMPIVLSLYTFPNEDVKMQDLESENIGEGKGINEGDAKDQDVEPKPVLQPTNVRKKWRTIIDDGDDDLTNIMNG